MAPSENTADVTRRTKVARLIDEYDLDGLGDELERLWTAEGDERRSLRELADAVNERLLESAIDEADVEIISADLEHIYGQLSGDVGTSADRTRIQRKLEREGVDVEALQTDFVTYQAVRSYLKKERNAEYKTNKDPIERDETSIQQLRNRTAVVTETKLDGLNKADEIELGPYQISVDINVFCEACGRQFDVTEILDRKGCLCEKS